MTQREMGHLISSTMRSMMVCSRRAPMFSTVLFVCEYGNDWYIYMMSSI